MSKVYSFRLSDDNPREAQARRVINARMKEGYSLRYVLVEAILDYEQENSYSDDFGFLLEQLQYMIEGPNRKETVYNSESSLPNTFKAGIVGSMKKGISEGISSPIGSINLKTQD